jgi:hypothetical protein
MPNVVFLALQYCEIFIVPHRHTVGWKWRHLAADGNVSESTEEYTRYFDCVAAAQASGYRPRAEWTHPVTLRNPANSP